MKKPCSVNELVQDALTEPCHILRRPLWSVDLCLKTTAYANA